MYHLLTLGIISGIPVAGFGMCIIIDMSLCISDNFFTHRRIKIEELLIRKVDVKPVSGEGGGQGSIWTSDPAN